MNKTEVLDDLNQQWREWEAFLAQIEPARLEQPGLNGAWTFKDLVAHLTGWQPWLTVRLRAAIAGQPKPPPPWPAHVQSEDETNAWIYETNHHRPLDEVLAWSRQVFEEFMEVVQTLPDDVHVEPAWHVVELGGERYSLSEFFDHFRDDHAADVAAWLG